MLATLTGLELSPPSEEYDVITLLPIVTSLPDALGKIFKSIVKAVSRVDATRIGTLHTTYSSFPFPVAVRVATSVRPPESVCTTRKPAPISAIAAPRVRSSAVRDECREIGAGAVAIGAVAQLDTTINRATVGAKRRIWAPGNSLGGTPTVSHLVSHVTRTCP